MLIALVGKSNVGKTCFFNAATLVEAEISNRIFTTIEPNRGVSYVRTECICNELNVTCDPQDGKCINGKRFIPVKIIDIAGLVPGAHEGRGLGNKFLSDIMEADAFIHVVDASGGTDKDGNPVAAGSHDPEEDVELLPKEIDYWMLEILKRNIRSPHPSGFANYAAKQMSGLKIGERIIEEAVKSMNVGFKSDDNTLLKFVGRIREEGKPLLVVANKIDLPSAETNKDIGVPVSAESELALRRAAEHGVVKYSPGDSDFEIVGEANEKQKKALEFIRENVLEKYGSTGVQHAINKAVFDLLGMVFVYPVENEHKFTDSKGTVLPNAFLLKKRSTPRDLAYKVHKDVGNAFIAAVDAKSGKRVAADYELKNGDVISIKTK